MSMTTELIKRLNEHADLLKEMGFDPDGMVMNDYKEAADTIQLLSEKLHASQMERSSQYYNDGWIPVSERLPEESLNSVIGWDVYRERCVFVQYIDGYFQIMGSDEIFDIVAWMPLPQPYKVESEDE